MPKNRTALVGVRDDSNRMKIYNILLNRFNYVTTTVSTQEKMLMLMNKREYDFYLMELDLGNPGSVDTSSAKNIYLNLEERIKKGDADFLCLCSNVIGLNYANKEEILACLTSKFLSEPEKFVK